MVGSVSASFVTREFDGTHQVRETCPVVMADVGWALLPPASLGPPGSQLPRVDTMWVMLQGPRSPETQALLQMKKQRLRGVK